MPGPGEELLGAPRFDEHARVHHVDALAHPGDDAQVVRDEDERGVALRDELPQEVEDLRLDRDVERRRRLVCDEELRLAGERHGDHRALAHAARELMRVVLQPGLGAGDADLVEKLGDAAVGLALVQVEVGLERLPDLPPDRQDGIEAGHRVLEDHRDLAPADLPELAVGELQEVTSLERRASSGHGAGAWEDAEQRQRRHALAAAGLAHDAQRLAGRDLEGDPVHGVHGAASSPELDLHVLDREERLALVGHRLRIFGSMASRRPSPIRLMLMAVITIASPGMIARCGAVWRKRTVLVSIVPHSGVAGS